MLSTNRSRSREGIPVVPGELPVFGHMFHTMGDVPVLFEEAVRDHGPLFYMRMSQWVLFCTGTEAFDLLKNRTTTSQHYRRVAGTFTGESLLGIDGSPHRRMRSAMNDPFTPRGLTSTGAASIAADVIADRMARLGDGPIRIHEEAQALALHIVFRVMGIPASDLDAWTARYQQFLLTIFPLKLDLPFLPARRAREASQWLDDRFRGIMAAASALDSGGTLGALLASRDDEGQGLTEREMLDNLRLLALAGHETTASTMAWIALELARRPELFDALVEESITAPGLPRSPEDLKRHPFAEALFRESLRLYPPVGFVTREATAPMRILGHDVPAGRTLGVPLSLFGRDAKLYPNPEEFEPSRWLGRKTAITPVETAAFGGGPHFCLGYHFAFMETVQFAVAFARTLHARGKRPRLADGTRLLRRYRPFAQPPKGSRIVLDVGR